MFLDSFFLKFQSTSGKVMSMLFSLNLNTVNMCSFPVHNIKSLVDRCFEVCIIHPLSLHHHLLHPDSLPVPLPTPVPLPLFPPPVTYLSLPPPLSSHPLSSLSVCLSQDIFPWPTLILRRSRVIGDYRGYRRLIAYYAVFDREGVARHWWGEGGWIGL